MHLMKQRSPLLFACGLLMSVAACQTRPMPADVQVVDDVPPVDSGGDDATPGMDVVPHLDGGDASDGQSPQDAGDVPLLIDHVHLDATLPDPCGAAAVIDLNVEGTTSGATTSYTGTNVGTPSASAIPGDCLLNVGNDVALSYQTATDTHLRVSTANPGTTLTFDTVAWMIDRCDPAGTSLGCSDDWAPGDRRSKFTTLDLVHAHTRVYIMVAGVTPPRTGLDATGTFALTVTEIPEAADGASCDVNAVDNVCSSHSHCIGTTTAATCTPDGTLGGRCRIAFPGCDTGFACYGDRLSDASRCVPEIPIGGTCDPAGMMNICVSGSRCLSGTCG